MPIAKFHLDPSNRLATIHQRHIRGVTIMRYINLHFTYLLTLYSSIVFSYAMPVYMICGIALLRV